MAWGWTNRERAAKQRSALASLEARGAYIEYRAIPNGGVGSSLANRLFRLPADSQQAVALQMEANDTDLTSIGRLTTLRRLRLFVPPGKASGLTDRGMEHVASLTSLESLELDGVPVTDSGLRIIEKLPHLEALSLQSTNITNRGLLHLQRLPALKYLDLHDTQVTGEGLRNLGHLGQLESLNLTELPIRNEDLSVLRDSVSLVTLNLNGTGVGDTGVALLTEMHKLENLYLGGRPEGRRMSELECLSAGMLPVNRMSPRAYESLASLMTSYRSDFSKRSWPAPLRSIDKSGILELERLASGKGPKRELTAKARQALCCLLNQQMLVALVQESEDANLSAPATITDAGVSLLLALHGLKTLDLSRSAITNEGVRLLSTLPLLEHLVLSETHITDEGIQHLSACRTLRYLDLSGTEITDTGCDFLALFPNLQDVNLLDTDVTPNALARLREATGIDASTSLPAPVMVDSVPCEAPPNWPIFPDSASVPPNCQGSRVDGMVTPLP